MTQSAFMERIGTMIDEAKTAILSTVDQEGAPSLRWMTPVLLPDRPNAVYAVTSPDFRKVKHLDKNPNVEWMFQTRSLDKVAKVKGKVNVIDDPMFKAEVMQAIGPRLTVFWKLNKDPGSLVVLETIVEQGVTFVPLKGEVEIIKF